MNKAVAVLHQRWMAGGTAWCGALLALGIGFGLANAQAQYPNKPIRLINPYAAGGPADVFAREIARSMGEILGQPVIIDYKPGAGAAIGGDLVAKSAPDGYTLLLSTAASHIVSPALNPKNPYDGIKDFAPVGNFVTVPNVLAIHPAVPATSVKELVALARAKPGRLNYASAGNGSSPHLAGELFKLGTGTFITHIPYRGAAPAVVDQLAGTVEMTMLNVTAVLPHVKSGRLRALAVTSPKRSSALPEVPSLDELGYKNMEIMTWYGIAAPAKTPKEIVDALYAALAKAAPRAKAAFDAQGGETLLLDGAGFARLMQEEAARVKKIIAAANIKAD